MPGARTPARRAAPPRRAPLRIRGEERRRVHAAWWVGGDGYRHLYLSFGAAGRPVGIVHTGDDGSVRWHVKTPVLRTVPGVEVPSGEADDLDDGRERVLRTLTSMVPGIRDLVRPGEPEPDVKVTVVKGKAPADVPTGPRYVATMEVKRLPLKIRGWPKPMYMSAAWWAPAQDGNGEDLWITSHVSETSNSAERQRVAMVRRSREGWAWQTCPPMPNATLVTIADSIENARDRVLTMMENVIDDFPVRRLLDTTAGASPGQGEPATQLPSWVGPAYEAGAALAAVVHGPATAPRSAAATTPANGAQTFDITLSFAGEDRDKAEGIAERCRARGITVFYDRYETASLWGKDLYQHLADVYTNKARFCVVFVSRHYAAKLWTNHELRSAQARAFRERSEYILPIRLDDTELPGVPATVGYVDWSAFAPDQIVDMLASKLGRASSTTPQGPEGDVRPAGTQRGRPPRPQASPEPTLPPGVTPDALAVFKEFLDQRGNYTFMWFEELRKAAAPKLGERRFQIAMEQAKAAGLLREESAHNRPLYVGELGTRLIVEHSHLLV